MPMRIHSRLSLVEQIMRDLLQGGPVAVAAKYHLDGGGSRARAILALDAASALNLGASAATSCACAAELLHNASLVHDDFQERDAIRRGRPALWRKFDAATAICAGDLMISAAFAGLASHPDPRRALTLMHGAVAKTAHGQVDDASARTATLTEYRVLVGAKTGPLLALPVRLALCAASAPGDEIAVDIGRKLSVAYQILDDMTDVDDDRAAGRVNICLLFEANGHSRPTAAMMARCEAQRALQTARSLAGRLPNNVGIAFCNLADRLDSALMELADAA
ncbi:MAG: polyprenyl synthetase family protein [Paracoccaceae bacterium]